jgi:ABC-2 type transport system ATP-binding protein
MLSVESVVKRFASVTAVDGVSMHVRDAEIVALIGPNGAGKTTLLRMLLGLTLPDSGSIRFSIDSVEARTAPARLVGYLPEERGLYQDVSVLRTLVYFGVLRDMSSAAADAAARRWLDRLGLAERMSEPVKALSKGNQQKVQFISAILHEPRMAILDEPFSGLDPVNQDLFLDLIRELRAGGTTILLSAHQMSLVERLVDRVVVLNRGRTVLDGTIPELRREWRTGQRLVLRVNGRPDSTMLPRVDDVRIEMLDDGGIALFVPDAVSLSPLLGRLSAALDIRDIESSQVSLHDVYIGTVAGVES